VVESARFASASATFSDDSYRIPVKEPEYRYLVCDLLTDNLIATLPLSGVTMDRRVSRVGELRGVWNIPNRAEAIKADLITKQVGRLALWVTRNKRLWWGGIMGSAQGKANSRTYDSIDVQAASFETYPFKRDIDADWAADPITDAAVKVKQIWDSMQAQNAASNVGVLTNAGYANLSGATLAQDFVMSDLKKYGEMIQTYTDSDPGCDYTIDVYIDDNGIRRKRLRTAGSFALVQTTNRLAISGYRVPSWAFTRDSSNTGTRFRAWGDPQDDNVGEEQQPVHSSYQLATDLIAQGWPWIDVQADVGTVPTAPAQHLPILNSYAISARNRYAGIRDVVQYEVDLATSEWHPNLIGQNVMIKHSKKDLWRPGQTAVITPVVVQFTPPDRGQPERVTFTIDGSQED
jgi:hypothetical protein